MKAPLAASSRLSYPTPPLPDRETTWIHLQRWTLRVLPALTLIGLAMLAVWGQGGVLDWYQLKRDARHQQEVLAEIERENQRLMRELRMLEEDPKVLERLLNEEGWASDGSKIYQFED